MEVIIVGDIPTYHIESNEPAMQLSIVREPYILLPCAESNVRASPVLIGQSDICSSPILEI